MHSYFFALLPTLDEREETARAATLLQTLLSLRGVRIDAAKLHLTLHFLGRFDSARPELEAGLIKICSWIEADGFTLELDRATGFEARGGPAPCVFEASVVPDALLTLANQVQSASGIPREHEFRPHVTWLRSRDRIVSPAIIEPVRWHCRTFSLMHGMQGGEYRNVHTWALGWAATGVSGSRH